MAVKVYSQEPVNSDNHGDVLCGQTNCRENEKHGHETCWRNWSSSNGSCSRRERHDNDFHEIEVDAIHLGDEKSSHSLVKSSTIHVNSRSDRKNKSSDSLVNTEVVFKTSKRDRKSRGRGSSSKGSDPGLKHPFEEGQGVLSSTNKVYEGQRDHCMDDKANDDSYHVHAYLGSSLSNIPERHDFTNDERSNSKRRVPHDYDDDPHDDLVQDDEELNHGISFVL